MKHPDFPQPQGLYDPAFEHDACGVGFVANIKGRRSHTIVDQALQILVNLSHRGACGCEENTGDGAGILVQKPHNFLVEACRREKISLPDAKAYGVGMVYMPANKEHRAKCQRLFEEIVHDEGQSVLGWRTVPTNNFNLGNWARKNEPVVQQVFIGRDAKLTDDMAFERKLYVIRKLAEKGIRYAGITGGERFYVSSLSYKTVIYKGMLLPDQVSSFFGDLGDPAFDTAIALEIGRAHV